MYAVFLSGGKQYKVIEGQIICIEKINSEIGKFIEFKQIMLISNGKNIQIGHPFINNSRIIAEIIFHGRSNKIIIIKFNRRKHYRKHQGHRQWFTNVKVINIKTDNKDNI